MARSARIEPAPSSNGVAGVTPSSLTTFVTADVDMAEMIIPGVQVGCAALISADTPAACGLDIEVPAIAWYRLPAGPLTLPVGCGVMPASTCTPGAVTFGLRKSAEGPRDEKAAIMSGNVGVAMPCVNVPVTPVWLLMKASRSAFGPSRWIVGSQWLSVSTSCLTAL